MQEMAEVAAAYAVPSARVNVAGVHVLLAVLPWTRPDSAFPAGDLVSFVHRSSVSSS